MAIRIVEVVNLPKLVVTPDPVVVTKVVTRKGDRHKGSRAEYMRSYRASKKPK